MEDIDDIADYIIYYVKSEGSRVSLINMKIQKLLYFIQAWSYGINNSPLFDGEFEAWIHGPINTHIYDRFCESKTLYSEINIEDCKRTHFQLSNKNSEFIDFILENYVKFSSAELEQLIQEELPWTKTRGHIDRNERCNKVISAELLKEYYGQRWKEINAL